MVEGDLILVKIYGECNDSLSKNIEGLSGTNLILIKLFKLQLSKYLDKNMLKFICSDKEFKKEFAKSFKDYEIKVKKDKYVLEYYNEEESSKEDIFENIYESLKTCRKVKNALEEINMFEVRMEEYKEG